MYELYDTLRHQKNCLSYLGIFNDEITDRLVRISEGYLGGVQELSKIRHRVSYLIVECFQNVMRHGEVKTDRKALIEGHRDFFQTSIFQDRVSLISSNLIEKDEIEKLEIKISQINSMNIDDLKQLYHETLTNKILSDKGGAGLGLIDMARKSGLPIKRHSIPLTDKYTQFFIGLEISNNKEEYRTIVDLKNVEQFYKTLVSQNVLMLYKGDLSSENVAYLVEMLQSNYGDDKNISSQNAKNLITLIEILQNVSKHAKAINGSKDGVFTISQNNGSLEIECGNFIEREQYSIFQRTLGLIKSATLDEIVTIYKTKLLHPEITKSGNCGLGLLEIARNSSTNFSYNFIETKDNEIFYSIKVKTNL